MLIRNELGGRALEMLRAEHRTLRRWLFEDALPLWAERGIDKANGGFYEKLAQDGTVIEEPRRTRLVSRQIFVFAMAIDLGWRDGAAARNLVDHGLDFLLDKCLSDAGVAYSTVAPNGNPLKPDFDLYDQAFALFALGIAARFDLRREQVVRVGRTMRDAMIAGWKHPLSGFEESQPPREPLNSNPHMHLLEAFLEWEQSDEEDAWSRLSDEIAGLAVKMFIDSRSGAVREHFDHDWRPLHGDVGRYVEPGHQFEWSWLLWRWAEARGRNELLATVARLTEIGEVYGVNRACGLAMDGIWDDLSARDTSSRLWPQTERIKAHLAMAELAVQADDHPRAQAAVESAADAARGLQRYFETEIAGLWHETLDPEGQPLFAPARASSLYHIVCAISEVERFIRQADYGR